MGTRDETRRELQDLAKLASVIPKQRPSTPVAGPDRASITETPGPPSEAATASDSYRAPSSASSSVQTPMATVLPSSPVALLAPSLPPGAAILTTPPPPAPAWRGAWAVGMGAVMALAMVGGLLLGQSLRAHPKAAAVSQPAAAVPTSPPVVEPSTPTVAPAPPTAMATPPASEPPAESAAEEAPAVTLKAPRPAHHAEKAPKPLAAASAPAAASIPGTKASLKASPSHSAAHDSLDDLIRKSASGN